MSSKYNLTLVQGSKTTSVNDLTRNGNNYVSDTQVDTSDWPDMFSLTVTDEQGNVIEEHEHARLLQQAKYDWDNGRYYLAFSAVSEEELLRKKIATMEEANTNTELALCELYESILGGAQ